jgi:hypothetical protein
VLLVLVLVLEAGANGREVFVMAEERVMVKPRQRSRVGGIAGIPAPWGALSREPSIARGPQP